MAVVWAIALALCLFGVFWVVKERSRRRVHDVVGGRDPTVLLPHSSEVELYSNDFSHCSRKTRLVLDELGIAVRHHSVDLIETGWYETISPAYLKINPSGLVPTLVHHGHPVFESDDILEYAQTIAGPSAPQLTPHDPDRREKMRYWLDFCAISSGNAMANMESRAGACIPGLSLPMFVACIQHVRLRRILVGFLFHFDRKRPALFTASKLLGLRLMMSIKPVRTLMHTSRDHMQAHLKALNSELQSHRQPWILGDTYSLADITLACLLLRLEETGWLRWFEQVEEIPEVTEYFERLKSRPAWKSAIQRRRHPIVAKAEIELRNAVQSDSDLKILIYGSTVHTSHGVNGSSAW